PIVGVRIYADTISGNGQLMYNGSEIGSDTSISNISLLTYTPDGENSEIATFDYLVLNENGNSDPSNLSTMSIDVTESIAPIVIDLDGDGTEFVGIEDGIELDVDDDGVVEQTAWAGNDDGVLFHDADNDGQISAREEFVFADYSDNPDATDLEGLKAEFDTNNDGIFDIADTDWDQFKVWQDKDGDGAVDNGEALSLDELGISAINLESDGVEETRVDGDITVHGHAEITYTDGSIGIAADAEFAYTEQNVIESEVGNYDLGDLSDDGSIGTIGVNSYFEEEFTKDDIIIRSSDEFQIQLSNLSAQMTDVIADANSDSDYADGGGLSDLNATTTKVDDSNLSELWAVKKY
ncbi:hypothetical protein IB678_01395, partial [Francisella adeliensis]|nr:hypothetical protein [Francisella adeliensis]MBK2096167.1 hypothetical protein [Francisella adeliensis]